MKNNDNKMLRLVLTLTFIGIVSALVLAFVYQWTNPYIEEHRLQAQQEAIFNVLPSAVEYESYEKEDITYFEGFDEQGNHVGIAVLLSGNGFQGPIEIMVGADPVTEKIFAITILEHQETPGLGARITEEEFIAYFDDKPFGDYQLVNREVESEYEIEAISGATVSTESVVEIVEQAIDEVRNFDRGEI